MKWMKSFLMLAVVVAMGLGAAGCGGGDDNSDPLVGTWKAITFNGLPMPATVSLTLAFRDNGKVESTTTLNGVATTEVGTWSAEGGIITVTSADASIDRVPYSISGSTLTLSDADGTFTLKKQ